MLWKLQQGKCLCWYGNKSFLFGQHRPKWRSVKTSSVKKRIKFHPSSRSILEYNIAAVVRRLVGELLWIFNGHRKLFQLLICYFTIHLLHFLEAGEQYNHKRLSPLAFLNPCPGNGKAVFKEKAEERRFFFFNVLFFWKHDGEEMWKKKIHANLILGSLFPDQNREGKSNPPVLPHNSDGVCII